MAKRRLRGPVLALLLAGAIGLAGGYALAQDATLAEGQIKDIAAFRTGFLARDNSYAAETRAEAEARLAALERAAGSTGAAAFELELARIAALADNGHTHYNLGLLARKHNRAPIRLAVFGEDFHVVRTTNANADLLGARLVAIDGHGVDDLRAAGRSLWGGIDAWRDRFAYNLLESPQLLNAAGLANRPEAATYTFATDAGEVHRALAGEPPTEQRPGSGPAQTLSPTPIAREDGGWRTALDPAQAPWSLQDWGKTFRWRTAPEIDGLVLDMRATTNAADMKIADALKMFGEAIEREKPKNLVLDLRLNGGGDLTAARTFLQGLPAKTPGRIFVLTSPLTFSAAISSTGYLKQAAPDRVSIVGEHVGDRMMFWAEGRPFMLPASQVSIGLATERHDYANGCRAYADCHRWVKLFPISVPTLAPDIAAPWTIDAYRAGRDPAMDAVAAALG